MIHGEAGGTPITLLGLVPDGWKTSGHDAPYESRLAVHEIIVGGHVGDGTRFTTASVRLLHLNEWANRRPWTHSVQDGESWQETVVFTDPGRKTVNLPGTTATLRRDLSRSDDQLSYVRVTSDEWVIFDFDNPVDLETIDHDYVRPLTYLIELAASQRSTVLELKVRPEGSDELSLQWSILSAQSRRQPPQPRRWFEFLFTLGDIDFDVVLVAWWKLQSEIGVVTDLVSSLRQPGVVSNQFLNAASAIESYDRHRPDKITRHRPDKITRPSGHEPTFAERVDAVIKRAGPLFPPVVGNPVAWRDWVKSGRNSVAHRDPKMVNVDKEWRTTIRVTESTRWLLVLVLLRDLGIPDAAIEAGTTRELGLAAARHYLEEAKPEWFSPTSEPDRSPRGAASGDSDCAGLNMVRSQHARRGCSARRGARGRLGQPRCVRVPGSGRGTRGCAGSRAARVFHYWRRVCSRGRKRRAGVGRPGNRHALASWPR